MLSIKHIARELKINETCLIQESLQLFVQRELSRVESELFLYCKKYGIKTIFEMDERLNTGSLKENDILDDFFAIDYLENRRARLKALLIDD